jgi:hypothetical protein
MPQNPIRYASGRSNGPAEPQPWVPGPRPWTAADQLSGGRAARSRGIAVALSTAVAENAAIVAAHHRVGARGPERRSHVAERAGRLLHRARNVRA